MKALKGITIVLICFVCSKGWSQSISINPSTMSPSSFNVTTNTAGDRPLNLLTNYSGQKITYSISPWWFFTGGVWASASNLPDGINMNITATSVSKGTSNGLINLTSSDQLIIKDINNARNATATLNQNIVIDENNFDLLKAGTTIVTMYYYIGNYI